MAWQHRLGIVQRQLQNIRFEIVSRFFFLSCKHEDVGDWGNTNDDYLFQSRRITSSEGGMPADPRYYRLIDRLIDR